MKKLIDDDSNVGQKYHRKIRTNGQTTVTI